MAIGAERGAATVARGQGLPPSPPGTPPHQQSGLGPDDQTHQASHHLLDRFTFQPPPTHQTSNKTYIARYLNEIGLIASLCLSLLPPDLTVSRLDGRHKDYPLPVGPLRDPIECILPTKGRRGMHQPPFHCLWCGVTHPSAPPAVEMPISPHIHHNKGDSQGCPALPGRAVFKARIQPSTASANLTNPLKTHVQ